MNRLDRSVIYTLKRSRGKRLDYFTLESVDVDPSTGQTYRNEDIVTVHKAIILSGLEIRDFKYDLSYIAANKNFTYGGLFDIQTRFVLIDTKDVPVGFRPDLNDRASFDDTSWEIKSFDQHDSFLLLVVVKLEGSEANEY